jgi:hypothetical protein
MNRVAITGAGIAAGGLTGLSDLAGEPPRLEHRYDPATDDQLTRRARRRMSPLACMVVRATRDAAGETTHGDAPLVYATANGEVGIISTILDALHEPGQAISASRFHNSVHNGPAGYWAIHTGRRASIATLTRAELSFEYALVEAWCRFACGAQRLLVTAGDTAIDHIPWADPEHCAVDLCGSLRLAEAPEQGHPVLGWIDAVRTGVADDLDDATRMLEGLRQELEADTVVADLSCLGGDPGPPLPGGARNPCSGAFHLLRALARPEVTEPLMLFKAGRDGSVVAVRVTPCGP